jgi:SAM-dependent methyltransferase
MGLGPPVLELYRQLKLQGALDGIDEVMELGSQDFWCPQANLVKALCAAFGRPPPGPELLNTNNVEQKPARLLYEALGLKYHCVDVDGRVGSLELDLNFDATPDEHKSKYGLVTNHGTSEHLLNQLNVFRMMHELARPGGVIVHAVPFTVHLEHGFFNYQPNFFECLARYNSYETLGIWVGPDWSLASFIPWDRALLDFLTLSSKTTHLLVVAQRKMYDREFCVPFQEQYEPMVPDEARSRYAMVIDGEVMDGKRVKYLTKDAILAKEYLTEIQGLKNWIDSYRGQIDALKHELAATQYRLDQARYGRPISVSTIVAPALDTVPARALAAELRFRLRRRLARMIRPAKL